MKGFLTVVLIIIVAVAGIVVPSIQYYNYFAFRSEFENETLGTILLPLTEINDEKAVIAVNKIVQAITDQGYAVEEADIDLRARVPGSVRFYSEKIFQASAKGLSKTEIIVTIRFRHKILIPWEAVITYTKELR